MTTKTLSSSEHLPDWIRFDADYVSPQVPVTIVVKNARAVEVFADHHPTRVGARFAFDGRFDSRIGDVSTEIHIEEVSERGHRFIEMWTDSAPLFCSFYSLILEIVADIVENDASPIIAISAAVRRWEQLLRRSAFIAEETQIGLFGELWLLRRLIKSMGPQALDAWVGPVPEIHDFRTAKAEFEVKTTTGAERRHTINKLGQLTPSVDYPLFLVSIQITNGGAGGLTLPEFIDDIKSLLGEASGSIERFDALLESVGYDGADRDKYGTKRKLRTDPTLVPIIDGTPRLTQSALLGLPPAFSPERISNVVYDIDVSGLGYADGSSPFLELIPNG